MPPRNKGPCLFPYPREAFKLHLMEGSEKKNKKKLALTSAYFRLLGVVFASLAVFLLQLQVEIILAHIYV